MFATKDISIYGCVVEAAECLGLAQSFLLQPENATESSARLRILAIVNEELAAWKRYLPEEMCLPETEEAKRDWECLDGDGEFAPQIILAHAMHNAAVIILNQGNV